MRWRFYDRGTTSLMIWSSTWMKHPFTLTCPGHAQLIRKVPRKSVFAAPKKGRNGDICCHVQQQARCWSPWSFSRARPKDSLKRWRIGTAIFQSHFRPRHGWTKVWWGNGLRMLSISLGDGTRNSARRETMQADSTRRFTMNHEARHNSINHKHYNTNSW